MQSTITMVDFFRVWYRFRLWFVTGLLVVFAFTWLWSKLMLHPLYKAESTIFVSAGVPLEQRIGFWEIEGPAIGRNEQYKNVVQGTLAEQYLTSTDFLLEVADRLAHPRSPAEGNPINLYAMLAIRDPNETARRMKLVKILKEDLIKIRQIQTTGVVILSAELPAPVAVARFVNACVELLQERFTSLDFEYYIAGGKLYAQQLDRESSESQQRLDQMDREDRKMQFDTYAPRAMLKQAFQLEREAQAKRLAQLQDKLAKWTLATQPEAKKAAQPIKVIERAWPPLTKSRPRTGINIIVAEALYTFVFVVLLVIFSYVGWSEPARRPRDEA
jgi:uncharacterized protein involved in exopolysaccharide biosynthesis